MKLRLRSIESKETLRIEVPDSCTHLELKRILSRNLPNSPPDSAICLSLNRKDELQSASPSGEGSLQILGLASGDLIFFSIDANLVQRFPVSVPEIGLNSNSMASELDSDNSEALTSVAQNTGGGEHDIESDSLKRKTGNSGAQFGDVSDSMEVSDECDDFHNNNDAYSADPVEDSFSVPGFLRKVFVNDMGDDTGCHKLTVVAIHAVLLESGFVCLDSNSNTQISGFQFRNEWPSNGILPFLFYTLPEIVGHAPGYGVDTVMLKFQSVGKFIFVYGSLRNEPGSEVHLLRLDEDLLVPHLNVVWANCGVTENVCGIDGSILSTSPEKELFRFWRDVKDDLALPLLIDLCEKAGLGLPPCFIRLPTELKMKIFESLTGVDVAKVSCVSSELRYLASNDELWMLKYREQFGNDRTEVHGKWKSAFAKAWERQKNVRHESRDRSLPSGLTQRRIRRLHPFTAPRAPRIIGGDFDIWPASLDGSQTRLYGPSIFRMRNFSPYCNLGGT